MKGSLALVAIALWTLVSVAGLSAALLPVLQFRPAKGWYLASTGSHPPSSSPAVVMAATIPIRHDPEGANTLPPHWALTALPATGIIVQAVNLGHQQIANHPQRRPPLTIRGARLHRGFEGVPRRYA